MLLCKLIDQIEFYTKEIEQKYDEDLFIVEFWTAEIFHNLEKIKEYIEESK